MRSPSVRCVVAFALVVTTFARPATATPPAVSPDVAFDYGAAPILSAYGDQTLPGIAYGDGMYLVAWLDARRGHIRGARVNAAGNLLDVQGFEVALELYGLRPVIVASQSAFLVAWGSTSMKAVRIAFDGRMLDATPIQIPSGQISDVSVASDGDGFLIAWSSRVNGTGQVRAARIGPDGTVLDPGGILLRSSSLSQGMPSAAFVGGTVGQYVVTWQESQLYPSPPLVQVSRVRPQDGAITPLSGYTGSFPRIAATAGGRALLAFQRSDVTIATVGGVLYDETGIPVPGASGPVRTLVANALMDALGTDGSSFLLVDGWRAWRISDGATVLDTTPLDVGYRDLFHDPPVPFPHPAVASSGTAYAIASETQLYGQTWDVGVTGVSSATGGVTFQTLATAERNDPPYPRSPAAAAGDGGGVVAWQSSYYTHEGGTPVLHKDIKIAHVRASDGVLLDPSGITVASESTSLSAMPRIASSGSGFGLAWLDGPSNVSTITSANVLLLTHDGATVAGPLALVTIATTDFANRLDDIRIASDGTSYLVVWTQGDAAKGALIDAAGTVTLLGSLMWRAPFATLDVASNGNGYLVVFAKNYTGIFARRFDATGTPVGDELLVSTRVSPYIITPTLDAVSVASNGTDYLVAWATSFPGDSSQPPWTDNDILAAHVDASGTVGPVFDVAVSPGAQVAPAVASDGRDYAITWLDCSAPMVTLRTIRQIPDGRLVADDANGGDLVAAWDVEHTTSIVTHPPNTALAPLGLKKYLAVFGRLDDSLRGTVFVFGADPPLTTPPQISCPPAMISECSANASASVTPGTATSSDPSATVVGPVAGTYPLGDTTVTYTATNPGGLQSTCTSTISVVDTTKPILTCPAPMTTECTSDASATVVPPAAASGDACTSVTLSGPGAGSYPLGTTTVTYTASDASGNTSACTSLISVVDTTKPSIVCPPPIAAECTQNNSALISPLAAAAIDSCTSVTTSGPASGLYPLGTTTVAYNAKDTSGNSNFCTTQFSVVDTTAPIIACPPPVTIECSLNESGFVVPDAATAQDACSHVMLQGPASGSYPLGTTNVTYSAQDGSLNVARCASAISVVDTTSPTIVCPPPVVAECTGDDAAFVQPDGAAAVDSCSPVSTAGPAAGFYPVGEAAVTYTATDVSNNAAGCMASIRVIDTTPPVVSCIQSYERKCAPVNGVSLASLELPVSASDSCNSIPPALEASTPWLSATGQPQAVVWTATDSSHNSSTCTSMITVDAAPPVAVVEDELPQFWPPNHKYMTVDLVTCLEHLMDPCNPSLTAAQMAADPSFDVVYVGSDEPASGGESGNTTDDIVKVDHRTVKLRVERSGTGDGRVYHVGITYANAEGAVSRFDCRYGVPHDAQGRAVDSWTYPPGDTKNPGFVTYTSRLASQP